MLLDYLKNKKEVCWSNPNYVSFEEAIKNCPLSMADVADAAARLQRFAPYFMAAFPETVATGGIVESPFREIPAMKAALEAAGGPDDIIVYTCANENAVGFYEKLGMHVADDVMVFNHAQWTGFTVE